MSRWYVLNEQDEPVWERDLLKAARWFQTANRVVQQDRLNDCLVSTVFLGLDHNFGEGPPVLWETMVFHPQESLGECYSNRYTSRAAAIAGHDQALAMVRNGILPPKPEEPITTPEPPAS